MAQGRGKDSAAWSAQNELDDATQGAVPRQGEGALIIMATIGTRTRKVFGTTVALENIDLRVEEGRIPGLIGPNGAGKTTAQCNSGLTL
jgi:ABC-type polysaccharide/polyol phosphate transport system ATPase subunit